MIETNLYRDHFQNFKRYNVPKAYGFEIDRKIYADANKWVAKMKQRKLDIDTYGFSKTEYDNASPNLFTEL